MTMRNANTLRLPDSIKTTKARVVILIVGLFTVCWIVIGLISLRFELTADWSALLYTQLIILGVVFTFLANAHVMKSGGFNRGRPGTVWQVTSYSPVLWAGIGIVGLLMVIWPVWVSFANAEPKVLLKVMFSLFTIGLGGTFAGFVSLASAKGPHQRYQRYISWLTYALIVLTAVEVLDTVWIQAGTLSGEEIGEKFGYIGSAVIPTGVIYGIVGYIMARGVKTERSRTVALIWYFLAGVAGFTLATWALWDTLGASALRLVLGATVLLVICSIGLSLLNYYNSRKPEQALGAPPGPSPNEEPLTLYRKRPSPAVAASPSPNEEPLTREPNLDDPYSPENPYSPHHHESGESGQVGTQERTATSEAVNCPRCNALVSPTANFCRSCGTRIAEKE